MLNTGIFPDELKIAKVIPLFKKDDPTLLKNYRPIPLLSTIAKVMEKIIFTQLSSYFNEHKLIFDNQYGFRPKHSTEYGSFHVKSTDGFHGPSPILLKFGTLVGIV